MTTSILDAITSDCSKDSLYRTARLRPDIHKQWMPAGFEPGEVVAVKFWMRAYDVTSQTFRRLFLIAKTQDFEHHIEHGSFSTVYDAALDSFCL